MVSVTRIANLRRLQRATRKFFFTKWVARRERLWLSLSGNEIGDEGLRHLSDALARGAAPALTYLELDNNPASDAAQQAVQDALKKRASRQIS